MLRRVFVATIIAAAVVVATPQAAEGFTIVSKGSWYGGPCDSGDNNLPASGIPNTVPGIAMRSQKTMRRYFLLTMKHTGRRVVVRHTDWGPASWTGRSVDVNYTAAKGLGYKAPGGCVQNFPTDSLVKVTSLTRKAARRWAKKTKTTIDN